GVCPAVGGSVLDADCSTPEGCSPVAVVGGAATPVCPAFPACVWPALPACAPARLSPAAFGFCWAFGFWPAGCSDAFGFLFSAFAAVLPEASLAAALLPCAPSGASKTTSRRLNFCSTRGFAPGCKRYESTTSPPRCCTCMSE